MIFVKKPCAAPAAPSAQLDAAGVEEAQLLFRQADVHVRGVTRLAVEVDDLLAVAADADAVGGEVREDLRYFRIASGLVFADDLRHLEARDLLHQQYL